MSLPHVNGIYTILLHFLFSTYTWQMPMVNDFLREGNLLTTFTAHGTAMPSLATVVKI
jgi:hypothetical protein